MESGCVALAVVSCFTAAGMETNGFVFDSTDTAGLDSALNRAMAMCYNNKAEFRNVQVGGATRLFKPLNEMGW